MLDLFGNHIVGFPTRRLISQNFFVNLDCCQSQDYDPEHLANKLAIGSFVLYATHFKRNLKTNCWHIQLAFLRQKVT